MPTSAPFTRVLTIADIHAPCKSVGAHVAAKLDTFLSDERTLTDEICDMLCIWLGLSTSPSVAPGLPSFELTVTKTTAAVEVVNGADLEITIRSPLGEKRCLFQAKVLDPLTSKLRYASSPGWRKLRTQLKAARASAGDLAFLLVYVPGRMLNGAHHGFGTYEQGYLAPPSGTEDSCYGVTAIPVSALLDAKGRWRSRIHKVPSATPGMFKSSVPFSQLLMELLLCARGHWAESEHAENLTQGFHAFRNLSITTGKIEPEEWLKLQNMRSQWLDQSKRDGNEI